MITPFNSLIEKLKRGCFGRKLRCAACVAIALALSLLSAAPSSAQDSLAAISTYAFGGVGGFIPLEQAYRLNYSTRTLGIPLEAEAGLIFPINANILTPLTVRYVRRSANFVDDMHIGVLSIEPGVRFFLEKQREKDFRVFAAVNGAFAQATVHANYEATRSGSDLTTESVTKEYVDLGLGFDVGFTYPLTTSTALDAIVHTGVFFTDPASHGGIGNIGGVSISALYRFGF